MNRSGTELVVVQGRELSAGDIDQIRGLIDAHPAPTRRPPQLNGRLERSFDVDETLLDGRLAEVGPVRLLAVHGNVERAHHICVPRKDVYVYALCGRFRERLCR